MQTASIRQLTKGAAVAALAGALAAAGAVAPTVAAAAPQRAVTAGHHSAAKHHRAHKVVKHAKKRARKATHKKVSHTVSTATSTAAFNPSAVSLTPFESRLVVLVNQARAADGQKPLTVAAGPTDVARRWALQLATDDALSHNPNLESDLSAAGGQNWTFLAENVGTGPVGDADTLFQAYMNSPHHRENILDPRATVIGMGAVAAPEPDGDAEWNVMDFENNYSDSYGAAHTHPVAQELSVSDLVNAVG